MQSVSAQEFSALLVCHGRDESLTRRQAQKHKATVISVMRTNQGSVASREPSAKTRTMCARVIKPKTTPVVMTYAFIESVSLHGVKSNQVSLRIKDKGNKTILANGHLFFLDLSTVLDSA